MRRPRLVYVVTHPVTADVLLRGQLAFMRDHGFDVTVIASPGPELKRVHDREGVAIATVPMTRGMDPRSEPIALARLATTIRALRPDIVNAGTPKAGLLGMVAARLASVPVRIYLLRGLRLETTRGLTRGILALTERVAASCAQDVACVSPSLLDRAVEGGYVPRRKALVVGNGSSNGYDVERYCRSPALRSAGDGLMAPLGIDPRHKVVAFVGRLSADKGIADLLDAFELVRRTIADARLLLLGGDLGDEIADESLARRIRSASGVIATGRVLDLAPWYARIDVLAFPSYREGFPNVPAEAGCAEIPVVGFRATGVVDVVQDGVTGSLVSVGDVHGLARSIVEYLQQPDLARAHGRAARVRIASRFDRAFVWKAWLELYRDRLERSGLPMPQG